MAAPNYKPIFKRDPSLVGGLASLLQGGMAGAQQSFENRVKDPNAPIGDNELIRLGAKAQAEQYAKIKAIQDLFGGFPGNNAAINIPVAAPGQANPQFLNQQQLAAQNASAPVPVQQNPGQQQKSSYLQMRNQLLSIAQQARAKGATHFDSEKDAFVDANGNVVM